MLFRSVNRQNEKHYCSEDNFDEKCEITLQNKDLWTKFHHYETEMIITKSGRRMFPSLRVQAYGLDPNAHYCVLLEFSSASSYRYKYSASGGWTAAGAEEAHSPHRIYIHPESPATGNHWMAQPISFGRLKLTNIPNPPPGHIVLSSMHKYQPRIIIVKTTDPRAAAWSPSVVTSFPETEFIAVTAYQNEKITKLKIDNNPFAKGFRENGQSKCKRKRPVIDEEIPTKLLKEEKISDISSLRLEQSSLSSPRTENFSQSSSISSSPEPTLDRSSSISPILSSSPYFEYNNRTFCSEIINSRYSYDYFHPFNYFNPYPSLLPFSYVPFSYQNSFANTLKVEHDVLPSPKKFTDFSIKTITGQI